MRPSSLSKEFMDPFSSPSSSSKFEAILFITTDWLLLLLCWRHRKYDGWVPCVQRFHRGLKGRGGEGRDLWHQFTEVFQGIFPAEDGHRAFAPIRANEKTIHNPTSNYICSKLDKHLVYIQCIYPFSHERKGRGMRLNGEGDLISSSSKEGGLISWNPLIGIAWGLSAIIDLKGQ